MSRVRERLLEYKQQLEKQTLYKEGLPGSSLDIINTLLADLEEDEKDANSHEVIKNGLLRYRVKESTYGYAIYEFGYALPLPFGQFCSEEVANNFCTKLNIGGPREVAKQYYVYKIAGNRDISDFVRRGVNPYQDWMSKNKNMFEREDRR